jgi:hypothetical protein
MENSDKKRQANYDEDDDVSIMDADVDEDNDDAHMEDATAAADAGDDDEDIEVRNKKNRILQQLNERKDTVVKAFEGWPNVDYNDFVVDKNPVIITSGKMYVFHLRRGFFAPDAKTYGDLRISDPNAAVVVALFQLMLHVFEVCIKRYMNSDMYVTARKIPFRMFAESIMNERQQNVEWRVFFYEPITADGSIVSVADVCTEAVNSGDYVTNNKGEYVYLIDPKSTARKPANNSVPEANSKVYPPDQLYRKITNMGTFLDFLNSYANITGRGNSNGGGDDDAGWVPHTMDSLFTIERAIAMSSKVARECQLNAEEYEQKTLTNATQFTLGPKPKHNNNGPADKPIFKSGVYEIPWPVINNTFLKRPFIENNVSEKIQAAEKEFGMMLTSLTAYHAHKSSNEKKVSKFNNNNAANLQYNNNDPSAHCIFHDYGIGDAKEGEAEDVDELQRLKRYWISAKKTIDDAELIGYFDPTDGKLEAFVVEHNLVNDERVDTKEKATKLYVETAKFKLKRSFQRAICELYKNNKSISPSMTRPVNTSATTMYVSKMHIFQ